MLPFRDSPLELAADTDPLALFAEWFSAARQTEISDPDAMSLATWHRAHGISNRIVLLKAYDARGFAFYTNAESAKGEALEQHSFAALLFHWKTQRRQLRIEGSVEHVEDEEANQYFASRPRGSQIGAWVSRQSRPLASRARLERAWQEQTERFGSVDSIPRPPFWGGYRVIPLRMEFWQEGKFRLHDRWRFTRAHAREAWALMRLYP